jgi:hypothetical protein
MADDNRIWEKRSGFVSEWKLDKRWILREPNDPDTAWGSLRIFSAIDMKPGYLRAIANFVTSRKKRTKEEMEKVIEDYQMDVTELEIYSVDEEITTTEMIHDATKIELEELFKVKIHG